jgi:hypothetical protein
MRIKILISALVLFSLLASCNMPASQVTITEPSEVAPVSSDVDVVGTAVELTAVARVTEIAGSAVPATATLTPTPTPTSTSVPVVAGPCSPTVTATVIANVRSGPGTAYDIVGSLSVGQAATIVGRNDAYTWWYIDYQGVAGNHAWIAGSVVTSACVPSVVQVVAAPPLPISPTPTNVKAADNSNGGNNLLPLQPLEPLPFNLLLSDLVAVGMQVAPNPATQGFPVDIQVKVKNVGNGDASIFKVTWWATSSEAGCNWTISTLAAGASKVLTCTYTYGSSNNAFPIQVVVDSGNTVTESNESNNSKGGTLQVSVLQLPELPEIPDFPFP